MEQPSNNLLLEFCKKYGIENAQEIEALYEIAELTAFMPAQPSLEEQKALQDLIGVRGESGYLDYAKSNNTFELIMQWRERTGNF